MTYKFDNHAYELKFENFDLGGEIMPFSCPWNDQESIIAIDPVEGEGITDTAETDVPNVA